MKQTTELTIISRRCIRRIRSFEGFQNNTVAQNNAVNNAAANNGVTNAAANNAANKWIKYTQCRKLTSKGDTQFAQVNPSNNGSVLNASLLNAGHHIGVNTQGCSMRNANRGLRSEPLSTNSSQSMASNNNLPRFIQKTS